MYEHYLWAASRSKYVRKDHKKTKCIFCGIAKNDPKIPKKVLYKDKEMMVIMNMFPYNVGHLEIVPVRHVVNLEDLSEKEFMKFWDMVKKSIVLLRKALNPRGFNIGVNLGGDVAGASIEHLHAHVVPRYQRDLGFMETTASTKVMPESIEDTSKILMKYIDILKK